MTSEELRKKFINFFVERGHQELPPASLIPENDPSVLFTTAGMQQFKRFYTHPEEAPAKNVVTIQPCLRTSDIELVGDDTHLTFFEMLGNFSFGGYVKKEAIKWAYEFLTKELGIESKRIKCSIFKGDEKNPRDDKSSQILKNMRIVFEEHGREDNFWGPTGNEGPCGPTVEFYVDGVEVWNLVFNEYYFKDGKYEPLKTKGVDTGMGLERMLVVLNGLKNVYETDVFLPIIQKIEEISGQKCKDFPKEFRIIADHVKAAVFAVDDGILPSNKDAGYIVRRLVRRSIVKMFTLSNVEDFISNIASIIFQIYPELNKNKICEELDKEEKKFRSTLRSGMQKFSKEIRGGIGRYPLGGGPDRAPVILSGKILFDLYQSYGFPLELTLEIAKQKNVQLEKNALEVFRKELKKHQDISRAGVSGFKSGLVGETEITTRMHTATHLLLKALQEVLGSEVHQRGSNINEERIRFDFSYPKPMAEEEIKKVENIVNQKIAEDIPVVKKETTVDEAKKLGAEAQFIEKYSQYGKLTMYSIGDFSHELCGGPHVKRTGEIGKFKITKKESSSAGIRRIRAIIILF